MFFSEALPLLLGLDAFLRNPLILIFTKEKLNKMNLLFRQYSPEIFSDKFSVYTDSVLVDGQFKTQYIAEMYGEDSGRYATEETDTYIKALRLLASFKQIISQP